MIKLSNSIHLPLPDSSWLSQRLSHKKVSHLHPYLNTHMNTTTIRNILLSIILLLFCGCSDSNVIKGSIFVVTQGADNKPLGAVNVYLFRSQDLSETLRNTLNSMKLFQAAGLERYSKAAPAYEEKLVDYNKSRTEFLQEYNKALAIDNRGANVNYNWPTVAFMGHTLPMNRGYAVDKYPAVEAAWKAAFFSEETIINKCMSSLPQPEVTTRTDATGAFTITTKGSKPIILVAESKRSVAPGVEEYYFWALELHKTPKEPIILSNHNLAATLNSETIISYTDLLERNPKKPLAPEPLPKEIELIPKS
ncbi:MAG: hypothetical protein WC765_05845 [Phycisphaerae bacterium]|jgi:hypothetical protein